MTGKPARQRLRGLADVLLFGLGAKGVGFVVPIVIAAAFGVSNKTDGFFLALAMASALTTIWGLTVEQFSVPLLAEVAGTSIVAGRIKWLTRRALAGAVGSHIVVGAALVAYLDITKPKSSHDALLCYLLLAPQVIASAWGAVRSAFLISRAQFRWSAGSVALRAIGVLFLVLVIPHSSGVLALAAGYSLGEIARSCVLAIVAHGFFAREHSPRGVIAPREGTLGRAGHQLGSMAIVGMATVAERSIAATLGIGAISRLEYASKIFYIPSVVFDTNFVSFFLGEWAHLAAAHRHRELRRDVFFASSLVFAVACLIAAFVLIYRRTLVHLVLARGAFPLSETSRVASLVGILIVALPFYSAAMLLAGASVALHENRLIMHVSLVKVGLRVGGAAILSLMLGLTGVAVAFVASHIAEFVFLLVRLPSVLRDHELAPSPDAPNSLISMRDPSQAVLTTDSLSGLGGASAEPP